VFEVARASGWGRAANAHPAPLLGLGASDFVPMPAPPFPPEAKTPAVADFVAGRPAVWIDDVVTDSARSWAAARPSATLLVEVAPVEGWLHSHVAHALLWAKSRALTP
jgi:hypothetical protein